MLLIVKQEGESQRKSNLTAEHHTLFATIDKLRDVPPIGYLSCVALVL